MGRFLPYLFKTLWRHRSRTLLTVGGTAVALFVFSFVEAVQEGLDNLQTQAAARRSLVVFQAHKFCPATSHLPQDYAGRIKEISGVREVVPIEVFTNNCRASLDVVVFYGVQVEQLNDVRQLELLDGDWATFEANQDAAIVGQAVAGRATSDLRVGGKFARGGVEVTVAGIFRAENPADENYVFTHLDFLQRRHGESLVGTVTQFEVLLDESSDPEAIAASIDQRLASGTVPTETRPKGVFQAGSLGDLAELIEMSHLLGLACVGLVLILVATTTLMSVQDRIREHGVLHTLGFSATRVFGLVLSESLILSLAGGLLGVAAALLVLQFGSLAIGAEAVTVAFRPSLRLAAVGSLVATVTGLLAGLPPALQAARVDIVSALRQR